MIQRVVDVCQPLERLIVTIIVIVIVIVIVTIIVIVIVWEDVGFAEFREITVATPHE